MTAVWILIIAVAAFLAVIVARACMFKPVSDKKVEADSFSVDTKSATEHLRQMVRLKTVSNVEESQVDLGEFEKFRALLRTLYPHVYTACEYTEIGRHGMLLKWPGHSAERPSVLMAHYDVVPADPAEWDEPPFEGVVKGGELWGRGTLDTKGTLMGVMEAAESLMALRPKTTYISLLAGMRRSWAATRPPSCRSWNAGASALPLCWTKAAQLWKRCFPAWISLPR